MKLKLKDKVLIVSGRDKGKTGEVMAVLPREQKVVVAGVNISKRHKKPTTQDPKGGIIELLKPIDASKVMVLDPKTNKPARVGWTLAKDGKTKDRVFKIATFANKKPAKSAKVSDKSTEKTADVPAVKAVKKEAKS